MAGGGEEEKGMEVAWMSKNGTKCPTVLSRNPAALQEKVVDVPRGGGGGDCSPGSASSQPASF